LGLGFQIQDDLLGTWGNSDETGKPAADDLRRRKKSLPILLLRERAAPAEIAEIDEIYQPAEIGQEGLTRLLELLAQHGIRAEVERQARERHDAAKSALLRAAPADSPARAVLLDRVESLASRRS
jgi:geranylgeranyl diphosphate synthase type I